MSEEEFKLLPRSDSIVYICTNTRDNPQKTLVKKPYDFYLYIDSKNGNNEPIIRRSCFYDINMQQFYNCCWISELSIVSAEFKELKI